jgi:hypothetical protein
MDDNATYPGRYLIQNTTSSNYYNASTDSWQAGAVINVLPSQTDSFGRHHVSFQNDTSASTLTVAIYSPTSAGGGDQFTNFGQVQLEWTSSHQGQDRGSSPIPTYDATITRAVDSWKWSNDLGRRVVPVEAGTIILRIKWEWDYDILSATNMTSTEDGIPLALAYHDANNWIYICFYKDGGGYELRFGYKGGGTLASASMVIPTEFFFNEGDAKIIVARWTSTAGELGITARSMHLFADGTKSAATIRTSDMTEIDSSAEWNIGTVEAGFGGFTGVPGPLASFSHIEVLPFPLSDGEILARP